MFIGKAGYVVSRAVVAGKESVLDFPKGLRKALVGAYFGTKLKHRRCVFLRHSYPFSEFGYMFFVRVEVHICKFVTFHCDVSVLRPMPAGAKL